MYRDGRRLIMVSKIKCKRVQPRNLTKCPSELSFHPAISSLSLIIKVFETWKSHLDRSKVFDIKPFWPIPMFGYNYLHRVPHSISWLKTSCSSLKWQSVVSSLVLSVPSWRWWTCQSSSASPSSKREDPWPKSAEGSGRDENPGSIYNERPRKGKSATVCTLFASIFAENMVFHRCRHFWWQPPPPFLHSSISPSSSPSWLI